MGKGEIARYEQFLLFPKCFQKVCFPGASKGVIVWKWVKQYFSHVSKTHNIISSTFNPLPDGKILDWSKLKQVAEDILKCI